MAHSRSPDPVGAGAPGNTIEITPTMIEAGVEALHRYETFVSLSPTLDELLVKDVLMAALSRASVIHDNYWNGYKDGVEATLKQVLQIIDRHEKMRTIPIIPEQDSIPYREGHLHASPISHRSPRPRASWIASISSHACL